MLSCNQNPISRRDRQDQTKRVPLEESQHEVPKQCINNNNNKIYCQKRTTRNETTLRKNNNRSTTINFSTTGSNRPNIASNARSWALRN